VRFHRRSVTKVAPEVKHRLFLGTQPGSWERLPAAAHRLRTLTPNDAAAAIVEAIERDRRLVLRPRMIYLLRLLNTLWPRGTERRMWR